MTSSIQVSELQRYDAGLLGNGGGGDVDWWQDYIRAELERAHEFYCDQALATKAVEQPLVLDEVERVAGWNAAIEHCAKIAERWRDENKAARDRARTKGMKRHSFDGDETSLVMAEQLDGAAIECNAIAAEIRTQTRAALRLKLPVDRLEQSLGVSRIECEHGYDVCPICDEKPLPVDRERVRQQGQEEGFAAAVQQLRDMGGIKPRPALCEAASKLADSLERSRIPMQAISAIEGLGDEIHG